MKLSALIAAATAGTTLAFPGMGPLMHELLKRQAPTPGSDVMIGDLATKGATTDVGHQVQDCLTGAISCQNPGPKKYRAPGRLGSRACRKDKCCVWDSVSKDLVKMYSARDGTCNAQARAAVRFGFHDAGAWSTSSGIGGADGSLLLSRDEVERPENNGLQDIRKRLSKIYRKYHRYGVGAADLVQFSHNVATVVCPLGPRLLTWVGRKDSVSSPTGLLPDTRSPPNELIDLFAEKTIGTRDLIALIGAHTCASQFFVDQSKAGQPLDSTPGVWDVKFYSEMLEDKAPEGVFRLPSDEAFGKDNTTKVGFQAFADPQTGQGTWNAFYATAYARLGLLGVDNINDLTDCTAVLPDEKVAPGSGTPTKPTATATATIKPTETAAPTATATAKGDRLKHLIHGLACKFLGICKVVKMYH